MLDAIDHGGYVDLRTPVHRRLTAFALVAALFVPAGAVRTVLYLCHMDGEVHSSRCCELGSVGARADRGARITPICCEAKVIKSRVPSGTAETSRARSDRPGLVAIVPPDACGPVRATVDVVRSHGARAPPPSRTAALYERHCSLLL